VVSLLILFGLAFGTAEIYASSKLTLVIFGILIEFLPISRFNGPAGESEIGFFRIGD
jgi:hypothetical protein